MNKMEDKLEVTRASSIKVLVVEDDNDDFYLVQEILTNTRLTRRYQLEQCLSLQSAMHLLALREFDVILLDLGLRDSHGLATLQELIKTGITTPVIVLTGINDDYIGEQAIKEGAEDYVPKNLVSAMLLSRSINYAIERHQLLLEIKRKAELDPLTQVPNRTSFYNNLEMLISQSERNGSKLALAILDLDGFKPVNDQYGHRVGDELLVQFSQRLRKHVRRSDAIARYGGDEFVVLLTNYPDHAKLRELIEAKHQQLSKSYSLSVDNRKYDIDIGVSIGIAEWESNMDAGRLFTLADSLMYQCKKSGKNAIAFYEKDAAS